MSSKIKGQMIKTPGVLSLNIDVDVYQGIVYLTGAVSKDSERSKIIEIAEETYGTKFSVDNMYKTQNQER